MMAQPLPRPGISSFIGLCAVLLLCSINEFVLADNSIIVSKSRQELSILKDQQVIKQYHIAYGKGGAGSKRRSGDKKTPVGIYRILEFKESDQFYFFMQLDYPNLVDAWHGYHNQVISATEFKSIAQATRAGNLPPQDTDLGGYIGIHGLGEMNNEKLEIHHRHNWTNGCIAMTNEEINDLLNYVDVGTRVIIMD